MEIPFKTIYDLIDTQTFTSSNTIFKVNRVENNLCIWSVAVCQPRMYVTVNPFFFFYIHSKSFDE